jgi:hypothetical protein
MSHDDQSDAIRLLTSKGLSWEEAQVVADLRAKGPAESATEPRAPEAGEWHLPAFWMAVGFLSLLALRSVARLAVPIIATASQVSNILGMIVYAAAFSILCCGAVYLLAKGTLDSVVRRLACRYAVSGRLRNHFILLIVALFLLMWVPQAGPILRANNSANPLTWETGILCLYFVALSLLPVALSAYAVAKLFPAARGPLICQDVTHSIDVERQVESWRVRLRKREALQEEDAIELEEHLREEMAALASGGLSEQEAFLIACRRIGPQDALEHEFAKVNAAEIWRTRAYWVVVGAFSILSFRIMKNCLWQFLLPWVGPNIRLYGFPDAVFWCLAFLLFFKFARGRKMPLADWLGRRHQNFSKLVADLTLGAAALIAVSFSANLAVYNGRQLAAFSSLDIPVLVLACFGIAMLHPTRKPQIAK